ncbi:hypothetical protein [Cysteiniphilum halobium]|uniref:hypothetical protein n=1 Tax=Cysteiniphilum halobium TaxID=2219059 RepID=UPI000E64A492|nr:hypothetical protein [Cysteiniphilum halobium]
MVRRVLLLLVTLIIIFGGGYYFFGPHDKEVNKKQQIDLHSTDPAADKLYQALQTANFIEQGQKTAVRNMYVIFDPNCIFCHALFEATQNQVNAGNLAIRWVPIGIIKRSSPLKAMAILSAKSPIDALKQNEAGFNYAKEEGGITPVVHPTNAQIEQFNHNMMILKGLINSVPVVVYKNSVGQARLSGGALLPLKADSAALVENEQKVDVFLKNVAKSW